MKDQISPEELKREKRKYKLIDVCEDWEYREGHIEGAENIPFSTFEWAEREGKIPKDKLVVVYCLHGIRSHRILKFLQAKGYKKVCHLQGSFETYENNSS
ncbi:MAG TPA: rhodanese-like domain-containing protein [Candidatus Nanoarchaeia archaeon]|nr:rhodanese-like domain-containing protein [Candidatus Nanoarchaeia archaeon]